MEDLKKFALRLKMYKKLGGSLVQNCAIFLREVLHRKGEIVQGYALTGTGEKFEYFWVEDEKGNSYDIGFAIVEVMTPGSCKDMTVSLVKEYKGDDYVKADAEIFDQFTQYRDEPSKFWKAVPRLKKPHHSSASRT